MNLNKKTLLNSLMLIAATTLVVYNIIRACSISITHDEALSYQLYISASFEAIVNNQQLTANNHIFNSILAKLCIQLFGDSLFIMRLPNILAHMVYMVFSFLISRSLFKNSVWVCVAFLMLQLNPFMFEFWSLCRGYGIVAASVMACAFFLLRYYLSDKHINIVLSAVFLCIGVYSNFAMLNFAMGWLIALLAINLYKRRKQTSITSVVVVIVSIVVTYLLVAVPIQTLKSRNELYYGGDTGFVEDTVGTLVQHSFFLEQNNSIVFIFSIAVVLVAVLAVLYWLVKRGTNANNRMPALVLGLLLITPAFSTIAQYHLFGTKFLLDRTALFFYPIYILFLLFTLQGIEVRYKGITYGVAMLAILCATNFVVNANINSTQIWNYDRHSPWLIERMISKKKEGTPVKMYLDWMYIPSLRYNIERSYEREFDYLEKRDEVAYDKEEYDYYLIREWEIQKLPESYILDTVFNNGQFYLYQHK